MPRVVWFAALGLVVGALLSARWPAHHERAATPTPPPLLAGTGRLSHLHVVAINGGGSPAQNYGSHLRHVTALLALLGRAGLGSDRVTIFSGDGSDPSPDLAVRAQQPGGDDFWRVEGTRLEAPLRAPLALVSSEIPGVRLHPATRAALSIWFLTSAGALRAGDTLLLYVTDHGTRDPGDPSGSRITLWGPGESLSTAELRQMLAALDPGVRVVVVMSQCFSGGFANLWDDGDPVRGCGYFSTTRERPAYGCYAENRGRDDVGHSFLLLRGLAATGRLADAHEETVLADATPDVPLRTSDLYLQRRLASAAAARGDTTSLFVDEMMGRVWGDPAPYDDDVRRLDQVGDRFGMPRPSSLGTLELVTHRLDELAGAIKAEAGARREEVRAQAPANLARFLSVHPIGDDALDPAPLLGALAAFTRRQSPALEEAHARAERTAALAYRTEVRLAAALRLRVLLTRLAGRAYLAMQGSEAERDHYRALRACEALTLPLPGKGAPPPPPEPFPTWDADGALAEAVLSPRVSWFDPGKTGEGVVYRGVAPSALAGQRRLLAFWATWCQPCRRELPRLTAVARARGVPVVAITDEPAEAVAAFVREFPDSLPENVTLDVERRLFARFAVDALPTVVLLSADGAPRSRQEGYSPLDDYGL